MGPQCKVYVGMYFLLMLGFIIGVSTVFTVKLVDKVGVVLHGLGTVAMGGTILMYVICALQNPGVTSPPDVEQPLLQQPYCPICQTYQAKETVHCPACGVCVRQRDHHCPWVGKCIGEGNSRSFHLFLICLFSSCTYILISSSMVR